MFEDILISKKEIGKFKLALKNPLGLTCEKITETPRVFNTAQIKNATENISFIDVEENILPALPPKAVEYLLKDFFLYMHQTGLYNRQFKLWRTLANITQVSISRLQKGLLKKNNLNAYMIDFFIDPKAPCIKAVIDEGSPNTYTAFKAYLSKALAGLNKDRIKGVFYFTNTGLTKDFIDELSLIIEVDDKISKYESAIQDSLDIRLNIIRFSGEDKKYDFTHVYPDLRVVKEIEYK